MICCVFCFRTHFILEIRDISFEGRLRNSPISALTVSHTWRIQECVSKTTWRWVIKAIHGQFMYHDVNCVHSDELPDLIQALATLFLSSGGLIIETLLIFCGLNRPALTRCNPPLLNIALRHYQTVVEIKPLKN